MSTKANEAARQAISRSANSAWDFSKNQLESSQPKTLRAVVATAIDKTRKLLATFEIPIPPDIRYANIKSTKVANKGGQQVVEDGCVMLVANFTTLSGVRNSIDIPVEIRNGQVVDPGVMIHDGSLKVISPSSILDIVKAGTFKQFTSPRHTFSAPMTHDELQRYHQVEKKMNIQPRINPGLFSASKNASLLRAAVKGEGALELAKQADEQPSDFRDIEDGVRALPDTETPPKCPDCDSLTVFADYDDDQFECATCGKVGNMESFCKQANQPASASLKLKSSPPTTKGDRIWLEISWDPEQTEDMSVGNIKQQIRSYVLRLANNKEHRDLGTISGNSIFEELDVTKGKATVSFKSSEVASPQDSSARVEGSKQAKAQPITPQEIKPGMDILIDEMGLGGYWTPLHVTSIEPYGGSWILNHGETIIDEQSLIVKDANKKVAESSTCDCGDAKSEHENGTDHCNVPGCACPTFKADDGPHHEGAKQAAIAPSNDDMIDPAERDISDDFKVGDEVKLEKGQLLRTRGGGQSQLEKGEKGKVVGDVYGDGVSLEVEFEAGTFIIPKQHLKTAGGPGSGRKKKNSPVQGPVQKDKVPQSDPPQSSPGVSDKASLSPDSAYMLQCIKNVNFRVPADSNSPRIKELAAKGLIEVDDDGYYKAVSGNQPWWGVEPSGPEKSDEPSNTVHPPDPDFVPTPANQGVDMGEASRAHSDDEGDASYNFFSKHFPVGTQISHPDYGTGVVTDTKHRGPIIDWNGSGEPETHDLNSHETPEDMVNEMGEFTLHRPPQNGGNPKQSKKTASNEADEADEYNLPVMPAPEEPELKQAASIPQIINELKNLREAGYPVIDVVIRAKHQYGKLGEQALKIAKAQGVLQ